MAHNFIFIFAIITLPSILILYLVFKWCFCSAGNQYNEDSLPDEDNDSEGDLTESEDGKRNRPLDQIRDEEHEQQINNAEIQNSRMGNFPVGSAVPTKEQN